LALVQELFYDSASIEGCWMDEDIDVNVVVVAVVVVNSVVVT
jgi:hypothetical protein